MGRCSAFLSLLLTAISLPAQILNTSAFLRHAAMAGDGSIYIAGTISFQPPAATPGVVQPVAPVPNSENSFVAKVAPGGDRLTWLTYFASERDNGVAALAVDPQGNLVVAGATNSPTLLMRTDGYSRTPARLFVAKLSPDGQRLLAGTYFGGPGNDSIAALKLDAAGNVHIAGTAESDPFPTTPGAFLRVRQRGTGTCEDGPDQFAAKFDANLRQLLFSTLIGAAGPEYAASLELGADGTVYVAGIKGTERGPCQAFGLVTRLAANGASAVYSTVAPSSPQGIYSLAVDRDGNAYAGSDTRRWTLSPPRGVVRKLDGRGNVISSRQFPGSLLELSVTPGGELVALGFASPFEFDTTPGAPGPCLPYWDSHQAAAYAARLDSNSLASKYAGFLPNLQAPVLVAPERLVALRALWAPVYRETTVSSTAVGPPPPGTVTCITNAASYASRGIAPGEIVSLFGSAIGPAEPVSARVGESGLFPFELGGVSVWVGGARSPVLYAAPGQINVVIPFGLPQSEVVEMEVRRAGVTVHKEHRAVAPVAMGLFLADWRNGIAAALNQDGTINSETNPANAGSVVSVFGTGFGAMSPEPVDGSAPPAIHSRPVASLTAFVDGVPTQIEYAGNAPGLVQGVVQINVRLPDELRPLPVKSNQASIGFSVGADQYTVAWIHAR